MDAPKLQPIHQKFKGCMLNTQHCAYVFSQAIPKLIKQRIIRIGFTFTQEPRLSTPQSATKRFLAGMWCELEVALV